MTFNTFLSDTLKTNLVADTYFTDGNLCFKNSTDATLVSLGICMGHIRAIEAGAGNYSLSKISPNPVISDRLKIEYSMPFKVPVTLSISEVNGKEIAVYHFNDLSAGRNEIELPIEKLDNGIYFVKI